MTDWDTVSELLREAGQEAHLARRMTEERNKRGWSQGELARQLEKSGFYGLGQPAISAIEKPRAGMGRRAITVDEAIALSRVFNVPLAELLLPDGALADASIHRQLRAGPEWRAEAHHQMDLYKHFVRNLAKELAGSEAWKARLEEDVEQLRVSLDSIDAPKSRHEPSRRYEVRKRRQQEIDFLEDVLKEIDGE